MSVLGQPVDNSRVGGMDMPKVLVTASRAGCVPRSECLWIAPLGTLRGMTPADLVYFTWLLDRRDCVGHRVLDIGGRDVNGSTRDLCVAAGRAWESADIEVGSDYQLDLTDPEAVAGMDRRWDTVLLFNILEHLYDPIRALEHAIGLVSPGGSVAVITPTVWQLHDWPADHWRPLPDFYIEFAVRHQLELLDDTFRWIHDGCHEPVDTYYENGQRMMPSRLTGPKSFQRHYSRVVHRLFRTTGRAAYFPWLALGVVFRSQEMAVPATSGSPRK